MLGPTHRASGWKLGRGGVKRRSLKTRESGEKESSSKITIMRELRGYSRQRRLHKTSPPHDVKRGKRKHRSTAYTQCCGAVEPWGNQPEGRRRLGGRRFIRNIVNRTPAEGVRTGTTQEKIEFFTTKFVPRKIIRKSAGVLA